MKPIYIKIKQKPQYSDVFHHYIVETGSDVKICEVFSPANAELILNALNKPTPDPQELVDKEMEMI